MDKKSECCFLASELKGIISVNMPHVWVNRVGGRPCCRAPHVHTATWFCEWSIPSERQCTPDELRICFSLGYFRECSPGLSPTSFVFMLFTLRNKNPRMGTHIHTHIQTNKITTLWSKMKDKLPGRLLNWEKQLWESGRRGNSLTCNLMDCAWLMIHYITVMDYIIYAR